MPRISTTLAEIRQLERHYQTIIPREFLDENQHVNVQYYVHLVERGLGEIFQRVGLGELYAAADEIGSFALEQHIRYLAELLAEDRVSVYIRLVETSPKRAYFIGFLVNDSREELASTVEVVMMNVDITRRRGAPFPAKAKAKLDALLSEQNKLLWAPPLCGIMRA